MATIRDSVKAIIALSIVQVMLKPEKVREIIEEILSIPSLAVVDREAELPHSRYAKKKSQIMENYAKNTFYEEAQQDMLKAGWVKEIKDV